MFSSHDGSLIGRFKRVRQRIRGHFGTVSSSWTHLIYANCAEFPSCVVSYSSLRRNSVFVLAIVELAAALVGRNGYQSSQPILGFFILALGVQLILNGISDWLRHLGLMPMN